VTLPLAHHNTIAALPVFVPAVIVCIVVGVIWFRNRGEWDEEGEEESTPERPFRP
jgi:hypothetical protein